MILSLNGIIAAKSSISIDTDAQAFITAASITDLTQQSAINQLVLDLKSANIWTKMRAIYPFVGGTATTHKFNLKDPRDLDAAFRMVFAGGGTHSVTGYQLNKLNSWGDTKFIPSTHWTIAGKSSFGFYSRTTSSVNGKYAMGSYENPGFIQLSLCDGTDSWAQNNTNWGGTAPLVPNTDKRGFFQSARDNSTTTHLYSINNNIYSASSTYTGRSPNSIYVGSANFFNATNHVEDVSVAFAYIGDDLSTTDLTNYYTIVQTFQTTLGRQVGVPIVADSDAQAFLNAAVITDTTQANAINTLVSDLKSANIWTKMKAIYPFVGGTASQHRFNLKDPRTLTAAYYLTFNGGATHSSNGVQFDGATGYANTFLAPNAMGQNNIHVSVYSRTNTNGLYDDIGAGSGSSFVEVLSKYNGNAYVYVNTSSGDPYTNLSSTGLYIANRIVVNTVSLFKNNTKVINSGRVAQTPTTYNLYLGAGNYSGTATNYSPREQAFASIGDGLTDAEATSLYNAVQTFNTALSRQV